LAEANILRNKFFAVL